MKFDRVFDFLGKAGQKFEVYCNYRPTPLNLKSLVEFGETAPASKSFAFLKNELPVRIANTLQEVRFLPQSLLSTKSVLQLSRLYDETFDTFLKYVKCDPSRSSVVSEFTDDLQSIVERHANAVVHMAMGIKEMRENGGFSVEEESQLHYFLNRFYTSRIGIRTLITQHVLLYGPFLRANESYIGFIDPKCSPLQMTVSAYAYARMLCIRVYGRAPGCLIESFDRIPTMGSCDLNVTVDEDGTPTGAFELFDRQPSCANLEIRGPNFNFCYIPGYLFHMLFELFKNAMRAVVEHQADDLELPRLHAVICNAPSDVTIKLSDKGGGMTCNVAKKAFRYTFTTASHLNPSLVVPVYCRLNIDGSVKKFDAQADEEEAGYSPLAGRGHGLPLSRLYARYLSGDLRLSSVEGHGTSAFIYMKRLPEKANEVLPIFNKTSKAVYQSGTMDCDWISGADARNGSQPRRPSVNA